MDIETFRWFMSTVAQTMGALTAIVVAVYVMWIERLRFLQEDAKTKAEYLQNSNALYGILLNSYNCDSSSDFLEMTSLDNEVDKTKFNKIIFTNLNFIREKYQRRLADMKNAQQLYKPITLSLITVFSSLVLLGIDRIVIPNIASSVWGWICFSLVCVFVLISLFLYFCFLFDVVGPYYQKHSRWKRFWKGLFDKDYPYNQIKN
ncbi:MAG: hypothetical protein GF403_11400 [Candidatus Coatesbacteria bacterium]|nr:hypothetical protein [Candidatus Coatesbacteria bacterium]